MVPGIQCDETVSENELCRNEEQVIAKIYI